MTDHACSGVYCRLCDQRGTALKDRSPYRYATPAEMNAVGSGTGRVMAGTSDTSRDAAIRVGAGTQREIAYRALAEAGEVGLTSIEVAERLPLTHQGYPQNSNRSASRLGELWEEGRVAVKRQIGVCVLGVCHHHDKPAVVHRPMAPCVIHGKPMTRGGAARWIAL